MTLEEIQNLEKEFNEACINNDNLSLEEIQKIEESIEILKYLISPIELEEKEIFSKKDYEYLNSIK